MVPSVRGTASRVSKRQANARTNANLSKVTTTHPSLKAKLEEAFEPVVVVVSRKPLSRTAKHVSKRKRDAVETDSETDPDESKIIAVNVKKVRSFTRGATRMLILLKTKVQLPTPPSSQRQSPIDLELSPTINFRQLSLDVHSSPQQELPPVLRDFVSLHSAFLKAFSLHIVHNGQTAPANLNSLMNSVTRLWKKRTVAREDIQRILAIYELDVSTHFSGRLLKHQEGPFKLTMTGCDYIHCNVEYVAWGNKRSANMRWDEYNLQHLYEAEIEGLWISARGIPTCWVNGELRNFPKLDFEVGIQTQARKAKAEAARREILGLSTQAQNRPGAQFAAQVNKVNDNEEVQKPQAVKDRTLSLLDRVRAKAAASSSATTETPEAVLRQYALGRITEVVDILRMKQQRKMSSSFMSSVHSSPSKVRSKVSFSMNQLISDIKGSLRVPLGDAEIGMCFKILENEVPWSWLSTYTVGTVQSVILHGTGLSGVEVKRILEEKE
ncbi:hypothetical protein H2200_004272 [Cladophialophora chaetospira]|uniref:DNA replication factor Cdt1 C-terminal domain-containing protein n=1 Tax=Cladophialophora chaetospira TaxID=386627 RepID=A0AA39CK97_9EURO|nr:hypothetical protein H2200_004272 [Cladophialophora chaetospira]